MLFTLREPVGCQPAPFLFLDNPNNHIPQPASRDGQSNHIQYKKKEGITVPVRLSDLKKKVGKVTLFADDGDDNALHVEYFLVPQGTVDDTLEAEQISTNGTSEEKLRYQAGRLKQIVASWDLLDDDNEGTPVPIETDALCSKVPFDLMMQILTAIGEDKNPNSPTSDVQ